MKYYRPTWAEIDLGAIRHNLSRIRRLISKDTKILVAVKANAYGHGISEVSKTLVGAGVDYLGVGTTDEALLLRRNGFKIPILILGSILISEAEAAIKNNITLTIGGIELAYAIDNLARHMGKKAKVHIKVDTGMGRIGVWHEDAISFIEKIAKMRNITVEGIFSHFPSADEDEQFTRQQILEFSTLVKKIEQLDIRIKYKHMANSIAAVTYRESHMNLIRPGLMIYGLYPRARFFKKGLNLKPALSLKSRIVFIKDVPAGRTISYGRTYKTSRSMRIATIPIGYGDGLSRRLSNRGHVLIKGERVPILGAVCMDQIMVDITHVSKAAVGEEVILIGREKNSRITVEEVAELCATIPYEVTCWLDNRIPRVYLER